MPYDTHLERSASDFKEICNRLGYKRHKVSVVITEKVTLSDLNWSGGSKSEYHAIGLVSGNISSPDLGIPAPWDNKAEGVTFSIPADTVIARTGWFCGKVSRMTLYVRPDSMPALLS